MNKPDLSKVVATIQHSHPDMVLVYDLCNTECCEIWAAAGSSVNMDVGYVGDIRPKRYKVREDKEGRDFVTMKNHRTRRFERFYLRDVKITLEGMGW